MRWYVADDASGTVLHYALTRKQAIRRLAKDPTLFAVPFIQSDFDRRQDSYQKFMRKWAK